MAKKKDRTTGKRSKAGKRVEYRPKINIDLGLLTQLAAEDWTPLEISAVIAAFSSVLVAKLD